MMAFSPVAHELFKVMDSSPSAIQLQAEPPYVEPADLVLALVSFQPILRLENRVPERQGSAHVLRDGDIQTRC